VSWLRLDVHSAVAVSVIMLTLFAATHQVPQYKWARFISAASFEVAFICALFALWQVANRLTRGHTTGGLDRGRALWRFEREIHLPSERSVQDLILGHPDIVRFANYYYDTMHLTMMVVFLVWLWLRHRDRYPFYRNMLAAFTAMALLIQMVAVAPPRLIGGTGLVDTAALYGQSVYAVIGSNIADQYAAMPSIHVGWAVLITYAVLKVSPSRWRWLVLLHGVGTIFIVVATANHYWMDGIVACALLVPAFYWATGVERVRARLTRAPEPAQIQQGAFS
jgi:PAP2 superfamily